MDSNSTVQILKKIFLAEAARYLKAKTYRLGYTADTIHLFEKHLQYIEQLNELEKELAKLIRKCKDIEKLEVPEYFRTEEYQKKITKELFGIEVTIEDIKAFYANTY
jgi:hypothetical protein